ncbi:hypothetical protein [Streptomyces violaceusniger]|uniref:Regulatory protein n=1 Tax=Streptomyces violaceusniger (strain Tu 4113) TaxID=653045 RepID=G2PHK6_STRV4|nr:hypothetical protein [Streptomyces violaceusniger]AEM89009.1 hypothetical protein Strvi_0236 [Streptomyces violaceusniger Tu 4113]
MGRAGRNERLAALLAEAQWNSAELARAIVALGRAQGLTISYDRTAPAHWLTGTRPRPPTPQLAAEAFTKRLKRLVTVSDTGLANEQPLTAQLLSASPPEANPLETVKELVTLCRTALDPTQGPVLARRPYAGPLPRAASWTAPASPPPTPTSHAGSLVLGDLTHTLSSLWTRNGGGQTQPLVLSFLAHAIRPEYLGEQPDLLAGYAQFAHLAAVTCIDCGQHGMAQRFFHTALHLSRHSGRRDLGAVTLRTMSAHALRLNYTEQAAELAQQAVDLDARQTSGALRSFVLAQRAVVLAAGGQSAEAVRDVKLMLHAWDDDSSSKPRPGPFTTYPRSGLDFQRSQVWRFLGEKDRAEQALHDALRMRAPVQRRPFALLHASLAELACEKGRIDVACRHWATFLDYYPYVWSAALEQALNRMHSSLAPYAEHDRASRLLTRAASLGDAAREQRRVDLP